MGKKKNKRKNESVVPTIKESQLPRRKISENDPAPIGIMQEVSSRSIYSGPLPPPGDLSKYEEAFPGAADRIIKMAETEQSVRHKLDTAALEQNFKYAKRGQNIGGIIAFVFVCGAVASAIFGNPWGIALGIGGLTNLIGIFLGRDKSSEDEVNK